MKENKKYIELNTFLKIKGIAKSGGEAKHLIRDELVKVNNEIETRNKRKLFSADKVEFNNETFIVEKEMCQKELDIKN